MSSTRSFGIIISCSLLLSCGGDSPTGNNGNNNGNNTTGTHMVATIDGQAFNAAKTPGSINILQVTANGGRYILSGAEVTPVGGLGRQLSFSLGNIAAPGTYPLGVDGVTVTGGFASITQNGQWTTPFNGASGSITVTTLTATRMTGTFNFTATAFGGGATGTKVVTNGSFDAPMANSAVIQTLADSIGSKLTATIDGSAWNGSTVSGQMSQSTLALLALNSKYNITIAIPRPTATGTFALSNNAGNILMVNDATSGSTAAYGIATDVGTMTITSLTTTRVKGTFSATLTAKPGTQATGTLAITNGTFDIGLYHN